ncbi:hypothetical protein THAR02_07659 [Trichoderma harzianum]|uniref:2EXR domain-containing protein n=1 Tax=Trichoderma harzianum TaxID=5544 RepID=A0A0F9X4W9_TRIHA|nr:hypothetical protein THAR02_07659 [Trichoderma harzianum]
MESRVCQFLDLPFEVRLMIWKHALNPLDYDRPGAHFFSLVSRDDEDEAIRISTQCKGAGNEYCSGYHLAAPKLRFSKESRSWTKNNPSAYLWDFGMWSACKESRQVIKAHYETRGWIIQRIGYYPNTTRSTVPFSLQSHDEKWHFVLRPKRDLVCIQAFDLSTTYYWVDIHRAHVCLGRHGPRFFDFSNVAVAYDPRWNDIRENMKAHSFQRLYEEPSARGFFIRTITTIDEDSRFHRRYPKDKFFWLIDYNMKRVLYPNKKNKTRKTFYSNDQVFTEVDKSLSRRNYSSGENSSALEFLDSLHMLLKGHNPGHAKSHRHGATDCYMCRHSSYNPRPYQIHRQVRVLMCEERA